MKLRFERIKKSGEKNIKAKYILPKHATIMQAAKNNRTDWGKRPDR